MGLPLAPIMANIFMCSFDTTYPSECPLEFKPIFYKQFIDYTILLFKRQNHANLFLQYINCKHNSNQFYMETETNDKLSFLDCTVTRVINHFETYFYRKDTFSGLEMSYMRFVHNCLTH